MRLALLLLLGASCDVGGLREEPVVLELGDRTIELPRGAALLDVKLDGRPGTPDLVPASLTARPGDVVRFTADDPRGHAIIFDAASLAPEQQAFLERTQQLRGPPLISAGATWVVSLEAAPPGRYAFVCLNHEARGELVVGS